MARNPAWTYDELILALDLYVHVPRARSSKREPALREVSDSLRLLPIHDERGNPETFRDTNSVYLKLQNFKTVDPDYTGVGMPAGAGRRERLVWERFADDPDELARAAISIREGAREVSPTDLGTIADPDDEAAVAEGRILLVVHRRRERKGSAKKKRAVLDQTGRLACEACGFDFEDCYGSLGHAFAECHHKRPLTEGLRQTRLRDLAIVCANCHRMIHRRSPPLAIEDLRAVLSATS